MKIVWKGDQKRRKPNLYVLAVGISKYDDPTLQLEFPPKDAQDFTETFKMQTGRLYENIGLRTLLDDAATKKNYLGLSGLAK